MARVGRRQQQQQQRPKREHRMEQEDGAPSCRTKRQKSVQGRSNRMPSEEDYTTDDFSDDEGGHSKAAEPSATAATRAFDAAAARKKTTPPRRWQPHEDKLLRAAVKQSGEANWKAIASKVGTRNHVQCLQRWKKVLRPGLVKGQWDAKEDELLMKLATAPFKNWGVLATRMAGRTSKQCRERWCHHLNPAINKGAYSEKEDQIIIDTQAEIGNKWSLIAARLPGRTENSIKIRCKALLRKSSPGGGNGGISGGSGGDGGGGGKSSSAASRPTKKSAGTSTTSTRQSQCGGTGERSLSNSSCFSPATSASASSSCGSELNGMSDIRLLKGFSGGRALVGGAGNDDVVRGGSPRLPTTQRHNLSRGKPSPSRGLNFEKSPAGGAQPMMLSDVLPATFRSATPSHCGGTGFEPAGLAHAAATSGVSAGTTADSSATTRDGNWCFGSKQETWPFLSSPSVTSASLMPEGVLFHNSHQQQRQQQQQEQEQQQQQQQQQYGLLNQGEFVDHIPSDMPFPNAFIGSSTGGGGGHINRGGNCSNVALESSSAAPAGGYMIQPQLMAPQRQQDHLHMGFPDFVPGSSPVIGSALEQACSNNRQSNALDFGDGELTSQTMAAAVVASGLSATGLGNNSHGCMNRSLTSPGGFGPNYDFGQHVDNDIRTGAGDDGGDESACGSANEQGPIQECCSFLDLANAASADDDLVGEVCPWQG